MEFRSAILVFGDPCRCSLDLGIDQHNEFFRLTGLIEWNGFERDLGRSHRPIGRPLPSHPAYGGLAYLQHTFKLPDKAVVQRRTENMYFRHRSTCAALFL
jgi:IS5 family transposase